jgi:hypothetical protein
MLNVFNIFKYIYFFKTFFNRISDLYKTRNHQNGKTITTKEQKYAHEHLTRKQQNQS